MFLKKIFCIIISFLLVAGANACTTFFINQDGHMVFGRNYDWMAGSGIVCTNQKGLFKTSSKKPDGPTINWVAKYGSISFNQYGKEFPTGGMNEKGLVVELMWLDGTRYPAPDNRPAIETLQWIQYQLDNSSTIDEVIVTDKTLRITSTGVPLHYLVADANGQAATIEFLEGKMIVHSGSDLPFPVLTNETYDVSIRNMNASGKNNSQARFTTTCQMIQEYKAAPGNLSLVDQSFAILNKVSQGDYTKWSIVYDITNKKVYFKTEQAPQIRSLLFSAFDFSCKTNAMALSMNSAEGGDISKNLAIFNEFINRQILEKTLEQSSPGIVISPEEKKRILDYPDTTKCQ